MADEGGTPGGEYPSFRLVRADPAAAAWLLDADGTIHRVDDRARRLHPDDDPAGRAFATAVDWTDEATLRSAVRRAADGAFARATAEQADGSRVFDASFRPVGDGDRILVDARDVTDRARDRRELAEERRKMTALHRVATELVRCESPQAVYDRTVEAAEEILDLELCFVGVVEDDVIVPQSSSREDAWHVNALPVDHGLAGKTLRNGEAYLVEDTTSPDNDADPVRESYRSGMSVPLGEDAVFQAVGNEAAAFDETDLELVETLAAHAGESARRARSERTLRRQNERLDRFASVVAHDLRNPLSVIQGYAEHARETGDPESLAAIEEAADEMGRLLTEVLQLSRAGEVVDETQRVSLSAVVDDAWAGIDAPDATLTVAADLELPADRSRLRQLLANLLSNAVEHAGPDAAIRIGTLDDGDGGGPRGFFVADDGPGVPPDEREAVFERGYTTREDGTGLGLAIVREIAGAHGWTVSVTDGAAGGARFEVSTAPREGNAVDGVGLDP